MTIEFKKIHWFYDIIINGEFFGTVEKLDNGKWKGSRADSSWIFSSRTRKQLTENMINDDRQAK